MDGIDGIENITGDDAPEGQPITLDELNRRHSGDADGATDHNAPDPDERRPVDSVGRAISDARDDVDEEAARRQAARDDSAEGAAEIRDNPGIDQGESSQPDERVPSTGEAADEPDEEQERREAARADSERAREIHEEQASDPFRGPSAEDDSE